MESLECLGGGGSLGGGVEFWLRGQDSVPLICGNKLGTIEDTQEIGEGPSSFLPSPKVLAAMGG